MLNILFAISLIFALFWIAKKFYFPTTMAQNPERYSVRSESGASKKDLAIVLFNLQRWKKEGKLSREEYDHITDICLTELQDEPSKDPTE